MEIFILPWQKSYKLIVKTQRTGSLRYGHSFVEELISTPPFFGAQPGSSIHAIWPNMERHWTSFLRWTTTIQKQWQLLVRPRVGYGFSKAKTTISLFISRGNWTCTQNICLLPVQQMMVPVIAARGSLLLIWEVSLAYHGIGGSIQCHPRSYCAKNSKPYA